MKSYLKLGQRLEIAMLFFGIGLVALTGLALDVPRFVGNSYIDLGTPDALQFAANAPLTVEAWVRVESVTDTAMVFTKSNGRVAAGPYTFMFGLRGSGTKMTAYTGAGGVPKNSWLDAVLPAPLVLGDWHHLAYSYDGTNMAFIFDGVLVDSVTYSYGFYEDHTVKIGGYANSRDLQGNVADVRVWADHARSEQQIIALRDSRLDGTETGLLGYWPMLEGSGSAVHDYSRNNATGTVINATWTTREDLTLLPPATGFLATLPFTLANIETGSERFTNSNKVNVLSFPLPVGVDQYQVKQSGEISDIGDDDWDPTNTIPAQLSFTTHDTDTNITLYAWFTNSVSDSVRYRSEGNIFYTHVQPVPTVRATLTRARLQDGNAIIYGADLDLGSTGGVANETELAIVERVALAVNPSDDLTLDERYVTLADEGTYPLLLALKNEAGNTITAVATCMVTVVSYSGANTWLGGGTSDEWHDGVNWSAGVPTDGQDVVIASGSLRLTEATAELASLTLAKNATISVEGWESSLTATNMTIAGTITHAAQTVTEPDFVTGEWVPQHRILLQGSNLTLTADGKLNADYRGYALNCGPGRPPSGLYAGAGHGGRGNGGFGGKRYGAAYGVPEDPWQPGSGGGASSAVRHGGGAICIEMTGTATVHGTITACGQDGNGTAHTPSGSGGSIAITCRTFDGSATGSISADGGRGNYYSGSSAGGRIALHYDPAAQADSYNPRPPVRFSTYAWFYDYREIYYFPIKAEMGTLYLTDLTLLAETPTSAAVLDGNRFWYTRLYIGSHPESWSPASLIISNCVVAFPDGFSLHVGQDLLIAGTEAPYRGDSRTMRAGLRLYAAATNELYGAWLTVGRDLRLEENAWLLPHTSGDSAAIVGMRVERNVLIDADGGINAHEKGFWSKLGNLNGPGAGKSADAGGAYGGTGGNATTSRDVYGSAALPLAPGSPGGWYTWTGDYTSSGNGGGVVHLLCGGAATINGTVTADGGRGDYYRAAGGSGGSIFIATMRLTGSGTLQADGGFGEFDNIRSGGGGRIAVWQHMPLVEVEARIAARNSSRLVYVATYSGFTGEMRVDPGRVDDPGNATAGSKGFYIIPGTLMMLR